MKMKDGRARTYLPKDHHGVLQQHVQLELLQPVLLLLWGVGGSKGGLCVSGGVVVGCNVGRIILSIITHTHTHLYKYIYFHTYISIFIPAARAAAGRAAA